MKLTKARLNSIGTLIAEASEKLEAIMDGHPVDARLTKLDHAKSNLRLAWWALNDAWKEKE